MRPRHNSTHALQKLIWAIKKKVRLCTYEQFSVLKLLTKFIFETRHLEVVCSLYVALTTPNKTYVSLGN